MSCTVIIIGTNPNNRLDPAATDPATRSPLIVDVTACSPHCVVTGKVVLSPDSTQKDNYSLAVDHSEPAKPAETYVLTFNSGTDARSWLEGLYRPQLTGKQVLIMDPSHADQPPPLLAAS